MAKLFWFVCTFYGIYTVVKAKSCITAAAEARKQQQYTVLVGTMLSCAIILTKSVPAHRMDGEQPKVAADPQTTPTHYHLHPPLSFIITQP